MIDCARKFGIIPHYEQNFHRFSEKALLQSWTKLVKKIANFGHIFQSNLRNKPPEEKQAFSSPLPLTQCCFEGRTMTQPWFQRQANTDEGERGAVLLMYRCSGRMWRWTTIFLTVLPMIVFWGFSEIFFMIIV